MEEPQRKIKFQTGIQSYQFYYNILSGFEIAGAISRDRLNTRVKIQIGTSHESRNKDNIMTGKAAGRYPMWKEFKNLEMYLEKELGLEPDMKISLVNEIGGRFFHIGDCCIPIESITKHKLYAYKITAFFGLHCYGFTI